MTHTGLAGPARDPATPVLAVSHLAKRFGGLNAVRDVSLEAASGSVLGVIGPNGSGKTTLINLLSGAYRADKGSIRLNGTETSRLPAHRLSGLGLARTFQNPHVFKTLTVRENLFVPAGHRTRRADLRRLHEDAERWLAEVNLAPFADRVASQLSGGQQKLVEFARAMVHRPAVMLMDEPFAGVHPDVKAVMHQRITEAAAQGTTAFLIVSHEIPDLVSMASQFVCMAEGSVLVSGAPRTVCGDQRVIDAYLGTPLAGAA
jgi:branched-chain amino acid transport system ATP-binding protein